MKSNIPCWIALRTVGTVLIAAFVAQAADVPDLIADLSSGDARKRREAAYELHQLGPEAAAAVPALIEALEDSEDQVFFHAVSAIASIGPAAEAAIPALISRLGPVRRRYGEQINLRCAFALSRIGAAAVEPLRTTIAISEPDETLCANAVDALAMMPPEMSAPAVGELMALLGDERERISDSVVKALSTHNVQAVPLLQQALRHGSEPQQRDAIRTLGLIGKDASIAGASIVDATQSGASALLVPALDALVRTRHDIAATTRLIVDALGSTDETTSLAAADAALLLAQITPNWDTTPFAVALEHADEPTRLRFAAVLGRIGTPAAPTTPQLISAAATASTRDIAHLFAEALGGIGPPATPLLVAAAGEIPLKEIDEDCWVVAALGSIGRPALEPLRQGLQSDNASSRAACVAALGLLGAQAAAATDDLFAMLKDSSPEVRGQALIALPRIGVPSERLLPLLEPLVADDSIRVRAQAFRAMGNIENNRALALPLLINGMTDPEPSVQASAIEAAGNLGQDAAAAVPSLKKVLNRAPTARATAASDGREMAAIIALGKIGPASKPAVSSLATRIANSDAQIRLLTLASLGAIGAEARDALPNVRAAIADSAPEVRAHAVEAFGMIETDSGALTDTMLLALGDEDAAVRDIAVKRLAAIGQNARPAAPRLFELLATVEEPRPIIDALRNIRARDTALYISVLASDNPSVRLFACEALGRFGSRARDALPELKKLQKDKHDFVRRRASQAIERINRRR